MVRSARLLCRLVFVSGFVAQGLTAFAAAPREAARTLSVSSNLMVELEVAVTTRVTGVIDQINADRGQFVKKGQALATLDPREFDLDERSAEAVFAVAEADFKRFQDLFNQKVTSTAELEQRRARFEQSKVDLERARLTIEKSVIRAPFDGVVIDRMARVGQKVLVEESVGLFKVSAMEPLLARAYLPEAWADQVRTGDSVAVGSVQFPNAHSVGRVTFISPVLDPSSGAFQVIVSVTRDQKKVFRPGTSVKMTFSARTAPAS